jgi:hypothetical protein
LSLACLAIMLAATAQTPAAAAPYRPLTGIQVKPAPGAVSITWFHDRHRRAVGYRVTAVAQELSPGRVPPLRIVVPAPTSGTSANAVFRQLRPRTPYVFWIEVIGQRTHARGLYYEQMFSSPGVRPL